MDNYSTNKTIFGLELSSNLLDKKIELLQVALVSPIVSEDLFQVLCQKLANDELTEDKILKNIKTLKNNTTLCGEQLNLVINRINSYIETHQVSCEEIKTLLDIKPELLEVFAHKTIKTAKDIFTLLKRNIFGQDQALQSLSIFFHQWLSFWNSSKPNALQPPQKSKIVIGGTGTGKTFIISEIHKILNLEIIRIDASSLVQSGYVGSNISTDIISGMINKGYMTNPNKKFLVFIDEFDKLAKQNGEIKGKSVLFELLNILESNTLKGQNSYEKNASQSEVSLLNVVFVFAGAFEGMKSIKNKTGIGFSNSNEVHDSIKFNSEDLINYGIPREVIGRISSPVELNKINTDTLEEILYNSCKGIKYFENFFNREKIQFDLENYKSDLNQIIQDAYMKNLGTRGLFASLSEYFDQQLINLHFNQ
jgi:ATP-dependent Clp protease ATP-binding subunit ClpX